MNNRVVVTGVGVVTSTGQTVPEFWSNLSQGLCGIDGLDIEGLEETDIRIGGRVKDFDPKARLADWARDKTILHSDRYSWLAAAAASEAIEQSRLEVPFARPYRVACLIGSAAGGQISGEKACRDRFSDNKRAVHPMFLPRIIGSSASAHVGIEFGVKGPTFGICSAGASAAHAIGLGRDHIVHGLVDIAIVGGADSALTLGVMLAGQASGLLSWDGCFPFARNRNGTVLAEGAGILVLESRRHAIARGAQMLVEICGFAMTSDSTDMLVPDVDGISMVMRQALQEAKLDPTEIDYVSAHAVGTRIGDLSETRAIKEVFGAHARNLPISSTKSMHGHTMGASGALGAVVCVEAMRTGWIPPTIGLAENDPECDLDYVPNTGRAAELTYTMSNSFGLGGFETSMILGLPRES
jgi:nodulation protein E